MIYEMISGGVTYKSICCDVICDKNAVGRIVDKLKEHYSAGYVGLLYYENMAPLADNIIRQLEGIGYKIKRKIFAVDSIATEAVVKEIATLAEDVRFILVIGDNSLVNAVKLDGRRYGVLLIGGAQPSLLSNRSYLDGGAQYILGKVATFVVADIQSSYHFADDRRLADVYGRVMALPLSIINHKVREAAYKNTEGEIYCAIEAQMRELLLAPFIRNSLDWHGAMVKSSMQIALFVSMLETDYDYIDTLGAIMSDCVDGELFGGEILAYSAWYILNKLAKLGSAILDNPLSFPGDIGVAVDLIAHRCGYNTLDIMKNLNIYDNAELLRLDYVIREYYPDLLILINELLPIINKALVSYKRIYNDAGKFISTCIDTSDVKEKLLPSSLLCREYSLLKHLFIIGYNL